MFRARNEQVNSTDQFAAAYTAFAQEAEFYADCGFVDDMLYAVPIEPSKIVRTIAIARRVRNLHVLIDSDEALDKLELSAPESFVFSVFLKVDCGYHRAGVVADARASIELAQRIHSGRATR